MNNQIQNDNNRISQSPSAEKSFSSTIQQSPVSISVTNSVITSHAGTPVVSTLPITSLSEISTEKQHTQVTPSVPIDNIYSPSAVLSTLVSVNSVLQDKSSAMDLDEPEELEQVTEKVEVTKEDSEHLRLRKLDEIDAKLDAMESIRLETVPILLDIIEQVKNGELSIKDVDNVCGRISLRLNKLSKDRGVVESELDKINNRFRCSKEENESTQQFVAMKAQRILSVIRSIESLGK